MKKETILKSVMLAFMAMSAVIVCGKSKRDGSFC